LCKCSIGTTSRDQLIVTPGRSRLPKYPTISLVIVNYNSGNHLADAVLAIAVQTFADFETIIVDSCSSDDSFTRAQSAAGGDKRFTFVSATSNVGFAAGSNLGAARARGQWIALLNPDAVPASDWLEQLLAATRRHPDVVMFGSTQIDAADPLRLDGAGDHYFATGIPWRGGRGWPVEEIPDEGEVFAPCAAACLVHADVFREARGFDERFFCYVEDIDLAFRLRLMGHRCIQVPAAVVRHVGAASAGQVGSAFAAQCGTRNLIWCFVKCMPGPLFWSLLPFHGLTLLVLAARAAATGTIRPVGGGIMLGMKGMPSIWQSRSTVQRSRRVGWWQIARSLRWNPVACMRRSPRTFPPTAKQRD
jgi:N-acetylglucosaminyl-diphospho-decaprenol L-rhamnosyltransferase